MIYKTLELAASEPRELTTELMFEVATARADGAELLRFDAKIPENEAQRKKKLSTILKLLKNMKATGKIQFFAMPESFAAGGTEAIFLINKYPELFESKPQVADGFIYFYIKL